jgi:type-F conjugative transfer system mating-pair stabilization protein TraN
MGVLVLSLIIGWTQPTHGKDMAASHQGGQRWAKDLLTGVQQSSRSDHSDKMPSVGSSATIEASPSALSSKIAATLSSSEVGQFLLNSQQKRPHFKLNPETDELFQREEQAILNPGRTLEVTVKGEDLRERERPFTVVCEESGDPYPQGCVVVKIPEIRLKYEKVFLHCHHWGWSDARKVYNEYLPYPFSKDVYDWEWKPDENLRHEHYRNEYRYQKRYKATNDDQSLSFSAPIAISAAEYQSYLTKTATPLGQVPPLQIVQEKGQQEGACLVLESLVEKGLCRYRERVCIDPDQVKVIHGVSIRKKCWAYRQVYDCVEPINGKSCEGLRAKGCVQTASICQTKRGGICLLYRQTYSCPGQKTKGLPQLSTQGGKSPFCLTGGCVDASYQANDELFEAMSHLAVLKEAQNDLRARLTIFKGNSYFCRRDCASFLDCCGVGKGWSLSLRLGKCDPVEKALALQRSENKCVLVGTYCHLKKLGRCLQKRTTYCCFGTKIARLLQEAGHRQLGLSWGDPQHPQCQGLTPEQFSRIDLTQVDFSELFQDIADQFRPKSQIDLTQSVSKERLTENMARLAELNRPDLDTESSGPKKEKPVL